MIVVNLATTAVNSAPLVSIPVAELDRLRTTERRYEWLIREHCHATHSGRHVLEREIDELIAAGFGEGRINGRPLPRRRGRPPKSSGPAFPPFDRGGNLGNGG